MNRLVKMLAMFTHARTRYFLLLCHALVELLHEVVDDLPATVMIVIEFILDALFST